MKRIAVPVYVMALSLILTLSVIGLALWVNHAHQQDLALETASREAAVQRFLGQMCERFEQRDEIQLTYLRATRDSLTVRDPHLASLFDDAIFAIEIAQGGCRSQLPDTNG